MIILLEIIMWRLVFYHLTKRPPRIKDIFPSDDINTNLSVTLANITIATFNVLLVMIIQWIK